MKLYWKKLLINLAIPLAAGGLGTLLSGGMDSYSVVNQPPLSPPGWLFPVVWSVLYLTMGYAAYRVQETKEDTDNAILLYSLQLLVNILWPIVFFRWQAYLAAFVVLLALWVLIAATAWLFYRKDKTAGLLMLPYLLWVTFAGYLNFGVYLLN